MTGHTRAYRVFIVRAWDEQAPRSEQSTLRFMLEIPETGARHGFATAEALLEDLYTKLQALHTTSTKKSPKE